MRIVSIKCHSGNVEHFRVKNSQLQCASKYAMRGYMGGAYIPERSWEDEPLWDKHAKEAAKLFDLHCCFLCLRYVETQDGRYPQHKDRGGHSCPTSGRNITHNGVTL